MSRTWLAVGITAALWAVFAGALLLPGDLAVTKHTGDAIHMVAIVERMAQGQLPHLDFMTPIGILAFWPIAVLVRLGLSVGAAFMAAQVILGALFSGVALAVALRRVEWMFALAFAVLVLVMTMALVHGEAEIAVSVSMHYNRWAWALGFIAVFMALLPAHGGAFWEGPILGTTMAALLLIKVTYFAAFAPIVIIGLLATRQYMHLAIALATGALIAVVLTAFWGLPYWMAYLGDLLSVAGSEVRAQPGLDFTQVLSAPGYLAATAILLVLVVILRRGGFEDEGLAVLLLLGAGAYITYQNFGNDPQHLALLALLMAIWAYEAPVTGPRLSLTVGAVALGALISSSLINLAVSPFRHVAIDRADYIPALVEVDHHQDLLVSRIKANRLRSDEPMTVGYLQFDADPPDPPASFQGEELPDCRGVPAPAFFASIAQDLATRGLAQGGSLFVMDILNPYWLYGDHLPLAGGTPWHYEGLPGFEAADYVLLPSCPINPQSRDIIATALADVTLTEVVRTPVYTLYAR
ncbi:MAG: hypothetical protein AAF576_08145 [Pseudomonadota bacterium]